MDGLSLSRGRTLSVLEGQPRRGVQEATNASFINPTLAIYLFRRIFLRINSALHSDSI
jgi:hypothetical protein